MAGELDTSVPKTNIKNTSLKPKGSAATFDKNQYSVSGKEAERLSKSLLESKYLIEKIPDAKERRNAKKLLSSYTKSLIRSSIEIKRSYKKIKRKVRGIGL